MSKQMNSGRKPSRRKIPDSVLLDDLRAVAGELGKNRVSVKEYDKHGKFYSSTPAKRFGSWTKALELAGLDSKPSPQKIPDSALLDDLRAAAGKLGKNRVTIAEYIKHGEYSAVTSIKRFGSWFNALKLAGLDVFGHNVFPQKIADGALLDDLRAVAGKLGKNRATVVEYDKHGEFSACTIRKRFGSWTKALKLAGLDSKPSPQKILDSALLDDLRAVAGKLGKNRATIKEYDKLGKFNSRTPKDRFGSWLKALKAAGLEPKVSCPRISDSALLDDLRAVAGKLGKNSVAVVEYDKHGEFSAGTIRMRFGPWTKALKAAGLKPKVSCPRISDSALLDDLRAAAGKLGKNRVTIAEYIKHGEYSAVTSIKRFGSWFNALKLAGLDVFGHNVFPQKIADGALLDDLRAVAQKLGKNRATVVEYDKHGEFSADTIRMRFGPWTKALKAAGLKPKVFRPRIPDSALLDDLRAVAGKLGKNRATIKDYIKHGKFGVYSLMWRFGSWSNAHTLAGLDIHGPRISDSALLDDLRAVAQKLGKNSATVKKYIEHGKFNIVTIRKRFGSWFKALEMAGLESSPPVQKIPDGTLLDDLRALAGKLGKNSVSIKEYTEHGKFDFYTLKKRFGSWSNALKSAGLEMYDPKTSLRRIPNSALLDDLRAVAGNLGKNSVAFELYEICGKFSARTLSRRFGSWPNALKSAGLELTKQGKITNEELFSNLENVWQVLGRQPLSTEMRKPLSKYSAQSYINRFGRWRKALKALRRLRRIRERT